LGRALNRRQCLLGSREALAEYLVFGLAVVADADWFSYPVLGMTEAVEIVLSNRRCSPPGVSGESSIRPVVVGALANPVYDASRMAAPGHAIGSGAWRVSLLGDVGLVQAEKGSPWLGDGCLNRCHKTASPEWWSSESLWCLNDFLAPPWIMRCPMTVARSLAHFDLVRWSRDASVRAEAGR
jgi:hypothetical protein